MGVEVHKARAMRVQLSRACSEKALTCAGSVAGARIIVSPMVRRHLQLQRVLLRGGAQQPGDGGVRLAVAELPVGG
eukprot:577165-Prorocentrum_minimum.AAC.1